jgi:hypothetical protein
MVTVAIMTFACSGDGWRAISLLFSGPVGTVAMLCALSWDLDRAPSLLERG